LSNSHSEPLPLAEQRSTEASNTLDAWYREYRQGLLSFLQGKVGQAHIAEELLQECFIRLSKMPALSTIEQPRAFIYKVAGNLAIDYLRRHQKLPDTQSDEILLEAEAEQPEQLELIVAQRRQQQLKSALEQLPPRTREALVLARFKEMPLKDVAKVLGISQTMVEKHLKNALEKCRKALVKGVN